MAPKNIKTKKRTYVKKEQTANNKLRDEIIAIFVIGICIFSMLSMYLKLGGVAGEYLSDFLFGIFGFVAFLIPVIVLAATAYKIANKNNKRLHHKLILISLLIFAIASFIHVIYTKGSQINIYLMGKSMFFPALKNYFMISGNAKAGGGLAGGLIGDLFVIILGKTGSMLILFLINLSLLVLLTEKSFFEIIKKVSVKLHLIGKTTYNSGKEQINEKKLKYQNNKKEKIQEREQETVSERYERQNNRSDIKPFNMLDKSLIYDDEASKAKESDISATINQEASIDIEAADDFNEALREKSLDAQNKKDSIQISFFEEKDSKKQEKIKIDKQDIEKFKEEIKIPVSKSLYEFPPLQLLKDNPNSGVKSSSELLQKNAEKLEQTLNSFGVQARVVNVSYGPTVTRYELQPEQGVKVSKIVNLSDDIALNLAASGIRIEAPIPGKALVGIEVPNKEVSSVYIKEVIDNEKFKRFPSKIAFALGKDISGETIVADIARMPHMLISGSTGSGKSVCINTLITSILYKASPNEVKLLMIDPKVVELKVYNGIPHLLIPVVTDPKKAAGALYWAVQEMSERYQLFANSNVRDLSGYNKYAEMEGLNKLPQIVIVVDELADLMQVAAKDVEDAICRLAQMARAAGIHLILATQRPSVDVITGIIKANIPSRIAFAVSSGVDSRTIIDMNGAEKLVGKGDMLYYPVGLPKPIRVQGAFISDKEVEKVVEFLKASQKPNYDKSILEQISNEDKNDTQSNGDTADNDSLFEEALELVIEKEKASASMIQRRFRVGYNRAARIVDQLYEAGYIGPEEGSKPRKVNVSMDEYYRMKNQSINEEEQLEDNEQENQKDYI